MKQKVAQLVLKSHKIRLSRTDGILHSVEPQAEWLCSADLRVLSFPAGGSGACQRGGSRVGTRAEFWGLFPKKVRGCEGVLARLSGLAGGCKKDFSG